MNHRSIIQVSITVCSWNVNQKPPKGSLGKWIFPSASERGPDIVVIGLQEVDMSTTALFSTETHATDPWRSVICQTLSGHPYDTYHLLLDRQLVGLYILLFAKTEILPFVRVVGVRCLPLGSLRGTLGNKGAIAVSLSMFDFISLAIVNMHLAPHQTGTRRRISQLLAVLGTELAAPRLIACPYRHMLYHAQSVSVCRDRHCGVCPNAPLLPATPGRAAIMCHDVALLFGDLNFRIDLPPHEAHRLIRAAGVCPFPCPIQSGNAPTPSAGSCSYTLLVLTHLSPSLLSNVQIPQFLPLFSRYCFRHTLVTHPLVFALPLFL